MGTTRNSPVPSLGLRFELLCASLLETLVKEGQLREWSWGEKIEGISTRPDFIIGVPIEPDAILFVSHGGRGGDGHKKFWRDLGELFALRRRWREPPLLIRLCFAVSTKRPLELRRAQLFDGNISVINLRGGAELVQWVEGWREERSGRALRLGELERSLKSAPGPVVEAYHVLKATTCSVLSTPRARSLEALWAANHERGQRTRSAQTLNAARWPSRVRRGLGALLLFPSLESARQLVEGAEEIELGVHATALFRCELIRETIAGWQLCDSDLLTLLQRSTDADLELLLQAAPRVALQPIIHALQHEKEEEETQTLLKALPALLAKGSLCETLSSSTGAVTFERLLNLIRFCDGRQNSFGYGALSELASTVSGAPSVGDPSYRLQLPRWVLSRGPAPSPALLYPIAVALERALQARAARWSTVDVSALCAWRWRHLYQHKLLSYRGLDPLLSLLSQRLPEGERSIRRCALTPQGDHHGASSVVYTLPEVLIYWQSAHGAHCGDKHKELAGRAAALRYAWEGLKLTIWPGRLILFLDGDWRASHLKALYEAGWDEIYAPQEIDALVRSVRRGAAANGT
ncbi:MAG: hypothetical protein VYD19_06730 [Myxococcota bacterium]|nr:hypothetical protein [Myxococcota bacterium]